MEQYMKQLRQRHKLLSYFLGLGVIIFFNCFGFPIINLNKEWSMMLTAIKIYVVLGGALFSGGGNVKKCAVGKHPKSEKLGSTGQAACCARIHSRYFTGGSPSGLRV